MTQATSTVTFEPATAADADGILALQRVYYTGEKYAWDDGVARDAITRLLTEPALGRVWVVRDGARLAGYAALTFGFSLEYGGRDAFIDEIFVASDLRGRGLAHQALALMEEACRAEGVRAMHLEVERTNAPAREAYRRAGLEEHARLLMTKRLV